MKAVTHTKYAELGVINLLAYLVCQAWLQLKQTTLHQLPTDFIKEANEVQIRKKEKKSLRREACQSCREA